MEPTTVSVVVKRFDPSLDEEPHLQTYRVPVEKGATVLSVLRYIYETLDHSLAYYCSCRIGKCGGCRLRVDGRTKLACTALVRGDLTLEPRARFEVIKDLVVDDRVKISDPISEVPAPAFAAPPSKSS